MIRVAIADDHRIFRQGLSQLLTGAEGLELVGQASDGDQLAKLCETTAFDVVVADVSMPGPPLPALIERHADRLWVILTMHADGGLARRLLDAGARAFVLKDDAFDDLTHAIRQVVVGRRFVSTSISLPTDESDAPPSERELEVLRLIARGFTTKRIAGVLGVSVKTIETYRARLMRKLRVQSGPELVFAATQRGWLSTSG